MHPFSQDFAQIYSYLSSFLNILEVFTSQNTFRLATSNRSNHKNKQIISGKDKLQNHFKKVDIHEPRTLENP